MHKKGKIPILPMAANTNDIAKRSVWTDPNNLSAFDNSTIWHSMYYYT